MRRGTGGSGFDDAGHPPGVFLDGVFVVVGGCTTNTTPFLSFHGIQSCLVLAFFYPTTTREPISSFFCCFLHSSGQASLASLVATPTGGSLVSLLSKTLQPAVGLMDRRIHTQRQTGERAYMRCGWFFSSSHFPSPLFLSPTIITAYGHVWDRTHLRYHGAAKAVGLGWLGWLSPFLFFHSPF